MITYSILLCSLQESINRSLLNLLTYPWIEERVIRGKLSIHGGYYDFTDCTFEKWTLDYKGSTLHSDSTCSIKNREYWTWDCSYRILSFTCTIENICIPSCVSLDVIMNVYLLISKRTQIKLISLGCFWGSSKFGLSLMLKQRLKCRLLSIRFHL